LRNGESESTIAHSAAIRRRGSSFETAARTDRGNREPSEDGESPTSGGFSRARCDPCQSVGISAV